MPESIQQNKVVQDLATVVTVLDQFININVTSLKTTKDGRFLAMPSFQELTA